MNRLCAIIGCLALCVDLFHARAAEEAPRVWAHYMPWFRAERMPDGQIEWAHWQWHGRGPKHDPDERRPDGRRDIASVYYPLIGPYDGRDPDVLEYHLLSARVAGIDAFVADWYGPDTYSDEVFAHLLRAAECLGGRAAVCLEEKAFFPGYAAVNSRAEVLDEAERQIRHVLARHAESPAYLRVENRPVFLLFVNHQQGLLGRHVLDPDELAALLARFGKHEVFFIRGHAERAYAGLVDGTYAWVGDGAYRSNYYAAARPGYVVGAAMPGFDDTGVWGWGNGPRVIERRGTAQYEEHWREVLEHQPDAVQLITWNDFQEGSTIEPSVEYGFRFLDVTEEWVHRYTGRPRYLKDNAWPHRLHRLRRGIAGITDEVARVKWSAKVDQFVEDLLRGRRFGMAFRLWRLESRVPAREGED
ncbi:MAG TPA: endo-1,3-alpha-glucanase family glycosylhydrolase [Kiritimatiellia bacterium]|nr:endo-1,3-alpha-glucanase family glycosylhydrolase [Kiritimatiellia bacterium]